MKRMKLLLMAGAFMMATGAFAQEADKTKAKEKATEVSKFEAGKKLTAADLGFLDLVYNSEGGKSRGKNAEINIAGHHAHADHALTAVEAEEVNKKIADYTTANKPEKGKSRGAGDCYYYCYYNAYGDYICYWYCY